MELRNIEEITLLKGVANPTALLNIKVNPEGNRNSLNALYKLIQKTPSEELEITIKKKTKKRSNNANSFMWVLLNKMAEELGSTANELYLRFIIDYGVYEDVSVPKRNERFEVAEHNSHGLGFVAYRVDQDREEEGNVIVRKFKGTSQYTQEEFQRLLNAVVDEAKNLDIDVAEVPNVIKWQSVED